jgi:NADH dehydrogenase [ubiquinone] 1 alpha subcomplex assembly factor 7
VSTRVLDAIRDRIAAEGPIDFATYMSLALYGSGGYYEEPPVGAAGDFVTSPHVHPVFGTFVAGALAQMATGLSPARDPLYLVEVGAGDGSLARQIIDAGLGRAVRYGAVEASAGARRALDGVDGVEVRESIQGADLVLAHELLDNLPFRLVRGGLEVRIDVEGDGLVERAVPIDDRMTALVAEADTSEELVVPVGALSFIRELADALRDGGYALIIDYGREGSAGGPVHGYRDHRPVEDVLAAPGQTDITAGVDFLWIARHAVACGLEAFGSISQHDALRALAFETWLREELTRQQEDLREGRGLEAVRTWSARSRARMLVDPGALGRLRWLVVASPGLPVPGWLTAAHDRKTD